MENLENKSYRKATYKCTNKCRKEIASSKALKGRERQFCLLLSNEDAVSAKLIDKLQDKVDINKLMQANYIQELTPAPHHTNIKNAIAKPKKLPPLSQPVNKVTITQTAKTPNKKAQDCITIVDEFEFGHIKAQPAEQPSTAVNDEGKRLDNDKLIAEKLKVKLMSMSPQLASEMTSRICNKAGADDKLSNTKPASATQKDDVCPRLQLATGDF